MRFVPRKKRFTLPTPLEIGALQRASTRLFGAGVSPALSKIRISRLKGGPWRGSGSSASWPDNPVRFGMPSDHQKRGL
jgi:hypothetical protein